ncbi:MAG: gamma-glutamyl-gamma-aminobutyrate hydrolase family protein [archaeon]|nr:gamma-glutamyl-gamma-aminobutyrate hydrolase family protein [archaeon]
MDSKKVEELTDAVRLFSDYEVIEYRKTGSGFKVPNEFDAIVLSGSEARIVKAGHVKMYEGVANLIENVKLPILGICFGHQLVCLVFGAQVGALKKPVETFENVRIVKKNGLFSGFEVGEKIPLAEHHNDYVKKRSLEKAKLELLADSSSCEVEAVRHLTKPFYGIQFHVERVRIGKEEHSEGLHIIGNFFETSRR